MNPEILNYIAGNLICKWQRDQDSACTLYVENGKVLCEAKGPRWITGPASLNITKWQVRNGLTSSQWDRVGKDLSILYMKEQQCQTPQKH